MRFLVDECTGPLVANWLHDQGYEVFSVYDQARGLDDDKIIEKAFIENWILITNDKDFGEKVFRERQPHRGIVFLRLADYRHRRIDQTLSPGRTGDNRREQLLSPEAATERRTPRKRYSLARYRHARIDASGGQFRPDRPAAAGIDDILSRRNRFSPRTYRRRTTPQTR